MLEIGVDHGEVGIQADVDGSGPLAEAVDPRAARGVGGEERGQVERLPGRQRVERWPRGSGLLTDQSLPAASAAPAACSDPNGYCQPARRSPRNGIVRLGKNAGLFPVTASSGSRRGSPRGNASIDQPPPVIHPASGWAAA